MSSAAATANLEGVGIHVGGRRVVVNRAIKPDEVMSISFWGAERCMGTYFCM